MISMEIVGLLIHVLSNENRAKEMEGFSIGAAAMNVARQNDKRPAWFKWAVPDEWVKNVKGDDRFQDVFLSLRIPREVYESWKNPKLIVEPTTQEVQQMLTS